MAKDIHTDPLLDVLQPIEHARGLPNAHYIDPAVHEEERQALWFTTWAGIGAPDFDIPEPGDAKPVDFQGVPLFMMRGRDNVVRVFQNVCKHRGMRLVAEPRKIEGVIRCPYHSWCYAHNGRLMSTPHVGGPGHNTHDALNPDDLGLIEVRSHIWLGILYVNLSGDAPAFEDLHAEMIERWKDYDQPVYHGGADSTFSLTCRTNWKLAVENYCESYHLPWVHPGLNSYSRLEDHYHIENPGKFSGQGTLVYRQLRDEDGTTFPDFANLSEKWDTGGEYLTVAPNVMLGVQRDHVFAIVLEPVGFGETREHIHLFYAQPEVSEKLRKKNAELWKVVFVEDIDMVEGMQAGRFAPGFDGGRFSPAMDGPTHLFHRWVAERLLDYRKAHA